MKMVIASGEPTKVIIVRTSQPIMFTATVALNAVPFCVCPNISGSTPEEHRHAQNKSVL
jgi:hypothetical protein